MVFSNKRGQAVFDLVLVVIVLFVIAIAAVLGGFLFDSLNDEIQADDDFSPTVKSITNTASTSYPVWFDNVILTILIFLWLMLIVTSFFIDAHPIFFIITVLLLVVVFIVGMAMANGYEELTADSDLGSFADNMPKTAFIFDNLLIMLIIIGLTTALALYAKGNV